MRVRYNEEFKDLGLTKGKEYLVIHLSEGKCLIIDDSGSIAAFPMCIFEKVEDVFMVECIDNKDFEDRITLNKKYPVIDIDEDYYIIEDDQGVKHNFYAARFKQVEPQKEVKEYSVMELFEEKEEIKFKIKGLNYIYFASNGILRRTIDGITAETLYLDKFILNKKFIKVEEPKPVTTAEAFKALEEGETIESLVTKDRYRYDTDKNNNLQIKFHNLDDYETALEVRAVEIEGQWIIKGDTEC